MIVPYQTLRELVRDGLVSSKLPIKVGPASIDLHLGETLLVPVGDPVDLGRIRDATPPKVAETDGFVIKPGEFVLGVTAESVKIPKQLAASVDGRSSIGRLGLAVHVTAGFIDPGFSGFITLEIANLSASPITLRAGVAVCQLVVSALTVPTDMPYSGRYQFQPNVPVQSRLEASSDEAASPPQEA